MYRKGKGKEQKPVRYCNTVSAASLSIHLRENVICLCVSHTQNKYEYFKGDRN